MAQPLRHLLPHYLLLILLFLAGGLAMILLVDRVFKALVIAGLVLLYVIWGVWHHYEEESLTREIVLEYAGVSGLVAVIFLLLS